MPELIATSALDHPPLTRAATTLAVAVAGQITGLAPYVGQAAALEAALADMGLRYPKPNTAYRAEGAEAVWAGRDLVFLLGTAPPKGLAGVAVTDQSDAWVTLTLIGPQAVAVLARQVSLDLRHVQRGQAFRSALNQIPLLLIVDGPHAFRLLIARSMARSAWDQVAQAMTVLDARLGLG